MTESIKHNYEVIDESTMLINISNFNNMSRQGSLEAIASKIICENAKSILSKEDLDNLRKTSPVLKNLSDNDLIYFVLFDERTTKSLFAINKKSSRKIARALKNQDLLGNSNIKKSPIVSRYVRRVLNKYRNSIINSIYGKPFKRLEAEALGVDNQEHFDALLNDSSAYPVEGY